MQNDDYKMCKVFDPKDIGSFRWKYEILSNELPLLDWCSTITKIELAHNLLRSNKV